MKEQEVTVEEHVTKVHGDRCHLADGTNDIHSLQPITL